MKKSASKNRKSKAREAAGFKNTKEIDVPKSLIGQVIGQESAVEIIRKAAAQKRSAKSLPPTPRKVKSNDTAAKLHTHK